MSTFFIGLLFSFFFLASFCSRSQIAHIFHQINVGHFDVEEAVFRLYSLMSELCDVYDLTHRRIIPLTTNDDNDNNSWVSNIFL